VLLSTSAPTIRFLITGLNPFTLAHCGPSPPCVRFTVVVTFNGATRGTRCLARTSGARSYPWLTKPSFARRTSKGSNIDFLSELLQEEILLITQGVGVILGIHLPLPYLLIQCGQLGGQVIHISNGIAKLCIALLRQPLQPIGKLMERFRHVLGLLQDAATLGEALGVLSQIVQTLEERIQRPREACIRCVQIIRHYRR
jgi:hypothetical protein